MKKFRHNIKNVVVAVLGGFRALEWAWQDGSTNFRCIFVCWISTF